MKSFSFSGVFFFLFLLSFLLNKTEAAEAKAGGDCNGVYIVYMGAATSRDGSARTDHFRLANYLQRRRKDAIIRNYNNGFSGFAAHLTPEEVNYVRKQTGVVSVFPDPILHLHTTRSWDFLEGRTNDDNYYAFSNTSYSKATSYDTIVGLLDTGVWPESESFNDKDMGPIPKRWKGVCMKGNGFDSSKCNKKLIGARYYDDDTARDNHGHGTHTASTATGRPVENATFHGLAGGGAARGGSAYSRLASYKVCSNNGCCGSSTLAAFDDAIADGVDVLSLSLSGSRNGKPDFTTDAIAIGAFHAVEKGITVVCSAGNSGPGLGTVENDAPWILTVGATTIDRHFESKVVLGGNKIVKGVGIHLFNIKKTAAYTLVYGKSIKKKSASDDEARKCEEGSLDEGKVKGKIVLCDEDDNAVYDMDEKVMEVKENKGVGLIVAQDRHYSDALKFDDFPATIVTSEGGTEIQSYLNSTKKPVATILPTETTLNYKPAPVVADFSARGPAASTRNLIKPDVAAPGVDILASWIGGPQAFNLISGTSMACPHVSGVAATVKSRNPTWSPAAVRSAILTTATQVNNLKAPITTASGSSATPYDYGAGEVSPLQSLQPGLVYETDTIDYLYFLCYYGYDIATIKLISPTLPEGFACPKNSGTDLISNINYPSIGVSKFDGRSSKTVKRTVTNVGGVSTYTVIVDAPEGLEVKVVPNKLRFTKEAKKLSYQVTFSSSSPLEGDAFGFITWTNGKYKARSTFVVTSGED